MIDKNKINRKRIINSLKLVVSLILLTYFIVSIIAPEWPEILKSFKNINYFYLLIVIFIAFPLILVSCLKWQLLLKSKNLNISLSKLIGLYLVGYFFNNIIPIGFLGGDFVRIYETAKQTKNTPDSLAAVFMERIMGIIALIMFAIFSIFLKFQLFLKNPTVLLIIICIIFILIIFIWMIFSPKILNFIKNITKINLLKKIFTKLDEWTTAINRYKYEKRALFYSFIYSIIYNLLAIFNVYFSFLTFNYKPNFLDVFLIVPIILLIVLSAPITFAGLGLFENANVYFFSLVGILSSTSALVALLLRAKVILLGLIGSIIYFFIRSDKPKNFKHKNKKQSYD
ncbi:hypothetical protein ES703_21152 [subsurface metagenome]